MDKNDTWTITVTMQVMGGDLSEGEIKSEAQTLLDTLLDGTDFLGVEVVDVRRDE